MNTDLDRVIKETDVGQIEQLLSNITFAELDFEDLHKLGDAHFTKLFRLSQLTIEYLLYT
jgi:zinc finger protein DZIP1